MEFLNPSMSQTTKQMKRRRIAIVGTGISGLSAAWLLNKHHDITVFEKHDRLGGHSNTVEMKLDGAKVPVDTGFIVYNEHNYPNLTKLFDELSVPTTNSCMSFSASLDGGRLEYGTTSWRSLFAQPQNMVRPRLWSMIAGILRLHSRSGDYLLRDDLETVPLGSFLDAEGFSAGFQNDHLLPMCAAIWSCPVTQARDYPATSFLRFFANHGLLRLTRRPQWKTVAGGSREYVTRLSAPFANKIQLNSEITRVERHGAEVKLYNRKGFAGSFDDVVLAGHADETYNILADADREERDILRHFDYQENVAYLHTDDTLMPRSRTAWASWNYIGATPDGSQAHETNAAGHLCVSYWMNRLQKLNTDRSVFVTLNPATPPDAEKTHARIEYMHPLFSTRALEAQKQLWSLQGRNRTWFCGAYFGSGFHEDGLQAGLAVAEQLGGVSRPWQVENPYGRIISFDSGKYAPPQISDLRAVA